MAPKRHRSVVKTEPQCWLSADRTCNNTTGETTTNRSWSLVFLFPDQIQSAAYILKIEH